MFLEATLLSIFIGKIRGGRFRNLENIHIKGYLLLILSAFIQIGLSALIRFDPPLASMIIEDYAFYLHLLSYILLTLGVLLNIDKNFMKIILFGLILNAIVIFSNGGRMPVAIDGINGPNNSNIIIQSSDIKHAPMTENTKMPLLGDVIRIPKPYPLPKIISVGDIFLTLGIFVFFQDAMGSRKSSKRTIKMIETIRKPI